MRPETCDRVIASEASAIGQSPSRSDWRSDFEPSRKRGEPGGATSSDTTPPSDTAKALWSPTSPVTAHDSKLGDHPASARALSREEAASKVGTCTPAARARRPASTLLSPAGG